MKKTFFILAAMSLALALSGCEKKTDATVSAIATAPPALSSITPTSDSSATATAQSAPQVNGADQIEATYQKNYQTALADANQSLQNKAKFCAAQIKYPGSQITNNGEESFFFYADELSKDYYWVVVFDGMQNNKKKRLFAARRDLTDEIKCMTNPTATPPSFIQAYQNLLASGKISSLDASSVALTTIGLQDTTFRIDIIGYDGQTIQSESVSPAAGSTATNTQTPTK
jgi:hypothetical protein